MNDARSLDERILAARSSQEIADLQAERSGRDQRVEGGARLASPVTQPGRVRVQCVDGVVDLPVEQLTNALRIDPSLTITGIGANAELQRQISECTDPAQLQQLMAEMNRQQK